MSADYMSSVMLRRRRLMGAYGAAAAALTVALACSQITGQRDVYNTASGLLVLTALAYAGHAGMTRYLNHRAAAGPALVATGTASAGSRATYAPPTAGRPGGLPIDVNDPAAWSAFLNRTGLAELSTRGETGPGVDR